MSNRPAPRNDLEQLIHLLDQIVREGRDYCNRYRGVVERSSIVHPFDTGESINEVIEASDDSIIRPAQDAAVLAKTVGPAIEYGIQEPGKYLLELGKLLRRFVDRLAHDPSVMKAVSKVSSAKEALEGFLRGERTPREVQADEKMNVDYSNLDVAEGSPIAIRYEGYRHSLSSAQHRLIPTLGHVDDVESLLDEIEECTLTLKSIPVGPSERDRTITPQEASKLSDDAKTLASVPVRSATIPRVADPPVDTIDPSHQPIPDPVGNAELTKLAGLHDADNVSRQIKDALRDANKAVKTVGPGHDREWTHRNLQDTYANLPHGKLKKLLRQTGFTNLIET